MNTPQGTTIYSALGGTGAALLSNKLTAVSATTSNLTSLILSNPSTSAAYVQLFDAPATGQAAPTLGTTASKLSILVPAGQTLPLVLPDGQQLTFFTAITAAATASAAGSDAPAGGISATFTIK